MQPRIILAMGRFAVQACCAATSRSAGCAAACTATSGVPVVVTYHPAYLLRTPADKARAWDDLCLAASVVAEAADAA